MKKNRLAGAGLALALAIGSVAAAGPALAADIWVEGDITATEGASYPAGWFTGNPAPPATPTGTDAGLDITGQTQLLYGGTIDIVDSAQLLALLGGADLATASGIATFQVPMFWNAGAEDQQFTTLRPANSGTPGDSWMLSRSVAGLDANTAYSLEEIAVALDGAMQEGDWTPQVLAFGVFVDPGQEALLQSVTFNGNTYHFTKQPAAPAVPVQKPATFTG